MIWQCTDKQIEYGNRVLIMGIVNVTPDSFSDGGCHYDASSAVDYALQLVAEGADIIDLGAQSTRPGYTEISPQQEWARLEPVIKALRQKTDVPISVDTYYPFVAENALKNGANIINDVSGEISPKMAEIVKQSRCGWVLMHNGSGDCSEIADFFKNALIYCQKCGIDKAQLCFDMGIGFGKSYEQNLSLIANIKSYKTQGVPLLLGTSRKRVIGTASQQADATQRIYGNIAADTVAIMGGVDIIRLHDVKNEKQGILTAQELKKWTK